MKTCGQFAFLILSGLFLSFCACNPTNSPSIQTEGKKEGQVNFNNSQKSAIRITKEQYDKITSAWSQILTADTGISPTLHFQEVIIESM